MGHEPTLDPRIDWFAEGLASDFEVCELGTQDITHASGPNVERITERRTRVRVIAQNAHWNWDSLTPDAGTLGKASSGLNAIERLNLMGHLPVGSLGNAIGALDLTEEDLARFRWNCKQFREYWLGSS
jgi:hypothetical protein